MKRDILVASFGTSYIPALKKSIEYIEEKIKAEFVGYDVYRAFTSQIIINKLAREQGLIISKPTEVLDELYNNGYEEVIIAPLHIIPGAEFNSISDTKESYNEKFKSIKLARPIFYYQGIAGLPDDYSLFIDSVKDIFDGHEGIVIMGHGAKHPSNAVYGALQVVLEDEGYDNVFVGTMEGYPTIEAVIKRIKAKGIKEVLLMPLLVSAGKHVKRDMASEDKHSWKSILEAEGIKVNMFIKGLGEVDSFIQLYLNRIKELTD